MEALKKLILVRHAHRDTDERTRDNGLSEKGKEQVKKLVEFGENRLKDEEVAFFTSPKKRCQETVGPLAKELKKDVIIDARLDEIGSYETQDHFYARMDEFIDFWKYECPQVTVVCSHGDWIPILIQKLTHAEVTLKKSGWCEIEYYGGECRLSWIVQKHY